MSNVGDKIDKIIAKYRMGFVVGDKDITTHYMDFKKELGEIVAEYYHRWVKYGYYGNGEDLDDDTEFNQCNKAIADLFIKLIEEEPTAGETNIIDKQSLTNKIKGGK